MIKVRVPATSANLGSGFDCFAVALDLENEVSVIERGDLMPLHVTGEILDLRLIDPATNLVAKAFSSACKDFGVPTEGITLFCLNRIPMGRGLGSSAAACVAGVLAAAKYAGHNPSKEELIQLAATWEGHRDNVAAAILGGFSLTPGGMAPQKIDVPEGLQAVLLVPDQEISTAIARRVLPGEVPLGDAVFNLRRGMLLVHALESEKFHLLGPAMEDRLHQPYRKGLFPEGERFIASALSSGAYGVATSGAGPAVLALCPKGNRSVEQTWEKELLETKIPGEVLVLNLNQQGAVVEDVP